MPVNVSTVGLIDRMSSKYDSTDRRCFDRRSSVVSKAHSAFDCPRNHVSSQRSRSASSNSAIFSTNSSQFRNFQIVVRSDGSGSFAANWILSSVIASPTLAHQQSFLFCFFQSERFERGLQSRLLIRR